MKNHELTHADPSVNDKENFAESEAHDYEKSLDKIGYQDFRSAERNVETLLSNLTWRGPGGSPRERYDDEENRLARARTDRLRLFNEAEVLHDFDLRRDYNKGFPESKFLKHLAETCDDDGRATVKTVPLSESETRHYRESRDNFIQYLSNDNNREHSFNDYIKSLVRMCISAYGENSRAMMYLCDDLEQMLSSDENKSKIIDRLIERKVNAVSRIATGETIDKNGYVLIGFTGVLDLPEGIENRSMKELADEGVPSLYGYNENA